MPWLQDTFTDAVWGWWHVTYRDVRILDAGNRLHAVYNLTQHDLAVPANREELKQLLLDAAQFVDTDHDQLLDAWENLHFGNLTPLPGDDPDHDGRNNFAEYAFGTDPQDAASRTALQPVVSGTGPERRFTVTFRQRLGSSLTYGVDASNTCQPWQPVAGDVEEGAPVRNLFDGTGTGRATWHFQPVGSTHSRQFLRVLAHPAPTAP